MGGRPFTRRRYTTADTYNPDGTLMHKRLCPETSPGTEGACPPPLGLRVTPHTDLIAASSSQLKQGGCKGDASERAIWTSRQVRGAGGWSGEGGGRGTNVPAVSCTK